MKIFRALSKLGQDNRTHLDTKFGMKNVEGNEWLGLEDFKSNIQLCLWA